MRSAGLRSLAALAAAAALGCGRLQSDEARYRLIDGLSLHADFLAAEVKASPSELTEGERRVLDAVRGSPGVTGTALIGADDRLRYPSQDEPPTLEAWMDQGGFGMRAAASAYEYRRPAVQCPGDSDCDLAYPIYVEGALGAIVLVRVDPKAFDPRAFIESQKAAQAAAASPAR